jgi:uncharacterized membrane protein YgcG
MTSHSAFRASDDDREHVAERLRRATAEGRLVAEELEDRLGVALTARTYGELDAMVADLPAEHGERPPSAPVWAKAAVLVAAALAVLVVTAFVVLLAFGLVAAWVTWLVFSRLFLGRHGSVLPPGSRHVRRVARSGNRAIAARYVRVARSGSGAGAASQRGAAPGFTPWP